jgi:H+/Cl- antiporter ClcA
LEKEGVERELRRTRKKTRFIAFILLGILLAAVGFVLLFVSTVPEGTELDQEVFQGLVPPDTQSLVPINRTDFGWVEITGEVLPCGLSFHALTITEVERFNETNVVPQGGIDCDNPTALIQAAANHVLIWNQDGVNSLGYRVQATYFSVSQPFAWLLFPAIGLIAVGLIVVAVVLIRRD